MASASGAIASKLKFVQGAHDWQRASVTCLPPAAGVSGKLFSELYIGEVLPHQVGNSPNTDWVVKGAKS